MLRSGLRALGANSFAASASLPRKKHHTSIEDHACPKGIVRLKTVMIMLEPGTGKQ